MSKKSYRRSQRRRFKAFLRTGKKQVTHKSRSGRTGSVRKKRPLALKAEQQRKSK